jgi:hypothetical protein
VRWKRSRGVVKNCKFNDQNVLHEK